MDTCKKEHDFFEKKNHVCPTCTQDLSDEFRDEKLQTGQAKVDEMLVGYNDILSAITDEESRFAKFTELSTEVNNINNTIYQTNCQITSTRKLMEDLQEEIVELQNMNPDKKAEFVKLETLVNSKKQLNKDFGSLKQDKAI